MKDVMVVDFRPNVAVNHPIRGLLEYLHDTYAPEINVSLWQEDEHLSDSFPREGAIPEGRLVQVKNPVPVTCVWVLLPCHCCHKSL